MSLLTKKTVVSTTALTPKRELLTTESVVIEKLGQQNKKKHRDIYKAKAANWQAHKKGLDSCSTEELFTYINKGENKALLGTITARLSPLDYAKIKAACAVGGFTVRDLLIQASDEILKRK